MTPFSKRWSLHQTQYGSATSGGSADDGTYLVAWNGHGDAVELARINGDGSLSAANRYAYATWGTPSLATVGSFGDLGFRYRYVGRFDVQWDSTAAVPAGLLYMHARHYHPEIGRFLQPDPSAEDANLYGYADGQPTVQADPDGLFGTKLCMCGGAGMGGINLSKLLAKLWAPVLTPGGNLIGKATRAGNPYLRTVPGGNEAAMRVYARLKRVSLDEIKSISNPNSYTRIVTYRDGTRVIYRTASRTGHPSSKHTIEIHAGRGGRLKLHFQPGALPGHL